MLAFYERDYPTAISMIKRALRHDNQNSTLLSHLCDALISKGERIEALKYLRKLTKIDPNDHEAFYKNASSELALGLIDEARESAETSLRLNPGHIPSHLILIDCDMAQDQLALARKRAEKIVENEALIRSAKQTLGLCLHKSGDSQAAKRFILSCIAQYPNEAHGYNNLHVVLKGLDEIEEAKAALLKAIELDPKDTIFSHNLAQLYMEQGNVEKGKVILRETLEAELENGIVRGPQLYLYVGTGRIDKNDNIIKKLQFLKHYETVILIFGTRLPSKLLFQKSMKN